MKLKSLLQTKSAIHCDTEEKAKILLEELNKLGFTWYSGYDGTINWRNENTCYFLSDDCLTHSPLDYAEKEGYAIFKFDEFKFDMSPENPIEKRINIVTKELESHQEVLDKVKELRLEKTKLTKLVKHKDYPLYLELQKRFEI